jgi:hypothetical protein
MAMSMSAWDGAHAQSRFTIDPATEVSLKNGLTRIDLDFDGKPDHIVVTYNDVQSAHNNFTYLFMTSDWRTIPFEDAGKRPLPKSTDFPGIHRGMFSTSQGADYTVATIRLLVDRHAKKTYAVAAFRDFGSTWVDSRPVTLELFDLIVTPPDEQTPMFPAEYFQLSGWFVTSKCYPDANFALHDELALKLPEGAETDGKTRGLSQPCSK